MSPLSASSSSSLKSGVWSITINNPVDADTQMLLPPGWKLVGQYEEGEQGTRHFQGMLTTPYVRFSQVKKLFPKAHIEKARSREALEAYVKKEDTRIGEFTANESMTMFALQDLVASLWNDEEFTNKFLIVDGVPLDRGEANLAYVDFIVGKLIIEGAYAIEFTAINPMWRSSWKKFGRQIILRYKESLIHTPAQEAEIQANTIVRTG